MDIVYICRAGDNEELRYSIRSAVCNLADLDNVWVIGHKPDWYSGNFIPVRDTSNKFNNIKSCIKRACEEDLISDDFILMNDDFFFLRNTNWGVEYYAGLLYDRGMSHQSIAGPNLYASLLLKTDTLLKKRGIEYPLNYDLHVPMKINKQKMLEIIDNNVSIRSYYGNIYELGGEHMEDVKIYSHPLFTNSSAELDTDMKFVSTEDGSFEEVSFYLHSLFNAPSIYEIGTE